MRDTTDPLDPLVNVEAIELAQRLASLPAPTLSRDELREATAPSAPRRQTAPSTDVVRVITGEASWYGPALRQQNRQW